MAVKPPGRGEAPARRGRPATFDRAGALEAAMELFWRHGFEGTSVAMLTAAMGCTAPTLYAAFGSKDRLHEEALELYQRLHGPAEDASDAATPAREWLGRYLRNAAAWLSREGGPNGCMVSTGGLQLSGSAARARGVTAAARTFRLEGLVARLEAAANHGELAPATDVAALARFYMAVIQGMSVQAVDGAGAAELDAVVDLALAAWPARGDSGA